MMKYKQLLPDFTKPLMLLGLLLVVNGILRAFAEESIDIISFSMIEGGLLWIALMIKLIPPKLKRKNGIKY